MEKSLFEQMGGTYHQEGDYLIPNLALPKTASIGIWGQRRRLYLREHRNSIYTALFLGGKLNDHLVEIDQYAEEMFSQLVKQMAESEGISEQLKANNQMEWVTGRVYIYYTVDEICNNLNCGRDKAMKLLAELDTGKGVGLIERIKQGQGKPTRIYVKRFTTQEIPPRPEKKPEPPAPPPAVDFDDVQKSDFPTLRGRDFRRAEVAETDPNQTKRNQIDFSPPSGRWRGAHPVCGRFPLPSA